MTQLALLNVVTVASPICVYQSPCPRKGRAELGEPLQHEGTINRSIRCLTCGVTGVLSTRTDL